MNFSTYKDHVRACWLGKNIGGTLGAPLEGHRGVFDLNFYIHDSKTGVIPNDDLDLQLVCCLQRNSMVGMSMQRFSVNTG